MTQNSKLKYLHVHNTTVPFYLPVSTATFELPIKLSAKLNHRCQIFDNKDVDNYFKNIVDGQYAVMSIDGFSTQFAPPQRCHMCKTTLIANMAAFYYHNHKAHCFDCGQTLICTGEKPKMRVNRFAQFTCDICEETIIDEQFYHNQQRNFDMCVKCYSENDANKKLAKDYETLLVMNNVFDPTSYAFGSLLEWTPVISIQLDQIDEVNTVKIVFQHISSKRFATCDMLTFDFGAYLQTAFKLMPSFCDPTVFQLPKIKGAVIYDELDCDNLIDAINTLSEKYDILDSSDGYILDGITIEI
jgi:hypothetical protein